MTEFVRAKSAAETREQLEISADALAAKALDFMHALFKGKASVVISKEGPGLNTTVIHLRMDGGA